MKSDVKTFHLGDVLSITSGRLVSPRHMDGVYDVLDHMSGDNLMTHQLPRVCDEVKPEILRQHPELADVDASEVTKDNWEAWLEKQVATYGEDIVLTAAPEKVTYMNPMDEAEFAGRQGKDHRRVV